MQCLLAIIGLSSSCGSEDAVLCQAVLDASLSVECWTCPDGITVNWTMTNSSGQQVELNTTEKTLNLSASKVNMQAAGCYQCKCEEAGVPTGVNFSMKVAPGGRLHACVGGVLERLSVFIQWNLSKMVTVFCSHRSKTSSLPGP